VNWTTIAANTVQMLNSFHDRHLLRCDPLPTVPARRLRGLNVRRISLLISDLWVRNADDGGTPGTGIRQDNYFYARITNRGTVAASIRRHVQRQTVGGRAVAEISFRSSAPRQDSISHLGQM
jgi:hypothetical protein